MAINLRFRTVAYFQLSSKMLRQKEINSLGSLRLSLDLQYNIYFQVDKWTDCTAEKF